MNTTIPIVPHEGLNVFQAIFVPLCGLLALRTFVRIWRGRVPRVSGYMGALVWSSAAAAIAFPNRTTFMANAVGITRGADLVFYLAILGGVAVCFYFYQRTRRLEILVTELMRRESLRTAEFGSPHAADTHFSEPPDGTN